MEEEEPLGGGEEKKRKWKDEGDEEEGEDDDEEEGVTRRSYPGHIVNALSKLVGFPRQGLVAVEWVVL